MLFMVMCLDTSENPQELRAMHQVAHRAHLARYKSSLHLGGPLVADDGETRIGSLFVIECHGRTEAEAFVHGDPFHTGGIWARVEVRAFVDHTG